MAVPKHASKLRQLFVVFRHGDRSPAFNPLEGTTEAAAHATHWAQAAAKLPSGYCNKFPVDNVNAQTFDAPHAPFQTLTHRGATELRLRGLNLGKGYATFIATQFALSSAKPRIVARASNFLRTQYSAQCLLSGLCDAAHLPADACIPITVRDFRTDNLSIFEAETRLQQLMQEAFSSEEYLEREEALAHVAHALTKRIPYFGPDAAALQAVLASRPPAAVGTDPPIRAADTTVPRRFPAFQRFMWIKAFDYLITFSAHSLPMDADMHSLFTTVHNHLLWRFRTLYSRPGAFAVSSKPLLAEQAAAMVQCINAAAPGDFTPIYTYAGHDVTILPMVLTLLSLSRYVHMPTAGAAGGAKSMVLAVDALEKLTWPEYGSAITLELREVEGSTGADAFYIRWTFRNEVLHPGTPAGPYDTGTALIKGSVSLHALLQLLNSA